MSSSTECNGYFFFSSKSISDLFLSSRGPVATSVSGSIAGLEGSHTLRRASSIRRAFTSGGQAGMKRHSVALQVKFQVDSLMEQLRRTKVHFVHCFLPQHAAGLCDVKKGSSSNGTSSAGSSPKTSVSSQEGDILMNVPLVRSQVRALIYCEHVDQVNSLLSLDVRSFGVPRFSTPFVYTRTGFLRASATPSSGESSTFSPRRPRRTEAPSPPGSSLPPSAKSEGRWRSCSSHSRSTGRRSGWETRR